ncbi:MAG: divalent-cation tolerance protein CutA [Candidatus Jordarchaeum sp.]|uniref:divalent-cation tolerance protein CutA n=1 Tax=Candidatus Jordarchaeum sp. TaxID=2823881 RepID=UPI00404ADD71
MVIIVFVTAANSSEAKSIAFELLSSKLAACVNIVPMIKSIYWWQGKIEEGEESLLIIKSEEDFLEKIVGKVKSIHSYEVPEIIAIRVIGGSKEYLNWIKLMLAS